jgi:hypothetical protein
MLFGNFKETLNNLTLLGATNKVGVNSTITRIVDIGLLIYGSREYSKKQFATDFPHLNNADEAFTVEGIKKCWGTKLGVTKFTRAAHEGE